MKDGDQLNSRPIVSVIISSYNHAHYIGEAIESVLSQTYKDIEIIVVDDGSVDNTKDVLAPYIKEGKIRYIYKENRGLSAARNTGLEAARGRYIKFLDSDDLLYPEQIELQVNQIKTSDNLLSISDHCLLRPNGEIVRIKYDPADDDRQLASLIEVNQVPPHTLLIPKILIEKAGGFDETLTSCEDWDLWLRILEGGAVVKHSPYKGCCYRVSMISMSANTEKMFLHKCKVIERVNAWLLKEGDRSLYRERKHEVEAVLKINKRLFAECIARETPIEDVLANALQMTDRLYRARRKGILKALHKLLGTKNYIRLSCFHKTLTRKDYKFNLLHIDNLWKFGEETRGYWKSTYHEKIKHFLFFRRLLPGDGWGGTEVVLMDWFSRIDYQKCRVTLVLPKGSKEKFALYAQAKSWPINIVEYEFPPAGVSFWRRYWSMFQFFLKQKPSSIIFVKGWHMEFHLAEVIAGVVTTGGHVYMHENVGSHETPEKSNRKYFGFISRPLFGWHRRVFPVYAKAYLCRKVLFVSKGIQQQFIELWGYPKHNGLAMYHGTDTKRYSPSVEIRKITRSGYGINESDVVVISTARLARFKSLDRLIDAFDKAAKNFKNIRLFLAGVGPLEQELKTLAASKAAGDRINFLGHVNNVVDLLKMSDIYVLCSDNEGLSLALLESMASGLICISTKCPGSGEVIENGVNGFLVERDTESVYGGLMNALILSSEKRSRMKQKARKTVMGRFNVETNVKKIFRLFGVPAKE